MTIQIIENFLNDDTCDEISKKVISLKKYWKNSNHKSEIYSDGLRIMQLGISSDGIDAKIGAGYDPTINYINQSEHEQALLTNINDEKETEIEFLFSNFGDLNILLEKKLTEILNKPCKFIESGTYYGFNIQTDYKGFDQGRAWHYDDQVRFYSKLLLGDAKIYEQYSFTIAISIPHETYFDYYSNTYTEYKTNPWDGYDTPCKQHSGLIGNICKNDRCPHDPNDIISIKYEKGMILIQKGRYLHRPGKSFFNSTTESRITIQFFATELDDVIWMYR